jgi:hypothetical protein
VFNLEPDHYGDLNGLGYFGTELDTQEEISLSLYNFRDLSCKRTLDVHIYHHLHGFGMWRAFPVSKLSKNYFSSQLYNND